MSFKVRTSEYNKPNLQDLGASLSQFINNEQQSIEVILTPSQLNTTSLTNILLILPPEANQYYIVNSYTSSLIFNTTPYQESKSGVFMKYGTTGPLTGISIDRSSIADSVSNVSNVVTTGLTDVALSGILGQGIYFSFNNVFSQGDSNVIFTIYYSTYTFS